MSENEKLYSSMLTDLVKLSWGPVEERDALKLLVSEMQRGKSKEVSDADAIKILKKLLKDEKELMAAKGETASVFMDAILGYLPEEVSEKEIRDFVSTIDFSKLKVKNAAIGVVKSHFGDRPIDGALVSSIINAVEV